MTDIEKDPRATRLILDKDGNERWITEEEFVASQRRDALYIAAQGVGERMVNIAPENEITGADLVPHPATGNPSLPEEQA